MPVVLCPQTACARKIMVADAALGNAMRCPHCGQVFRVSSPPPTVPSAVVPLPLPSPAASTTQLAVFSDDGCDVWIDGVLVLNNFKKGQHLPDLKQSLHVLDKFKPVAGRMYHVRIHYCNTIFTGKTDIDGCTLFAYAGGVEMPEAHIDTDINRDGKIDKEDMGAEKKLKTGTLVIRDKDNVYSDKAEDEPARRRKIVLSLSGGAKGKVVVERGAKVEKLAKNLRLFDKASIADGKEIKFNDKNEVMLDPGEYWLQGGVEASEAARDQFLKVRPDMKSATFSEIPTPSGLSGVFGDSLSGYVVHRRLLWTHRIPPVSCSERHL